MTGRRSRSGLSAIVGALAIVPIGILTDRARRVTILVVCIGIWCATMSSVPGERIAVSISPGAIALTRMPSGPKSAAISRVSDASAAFDVA